MALGGVKMSQRRTLGKRKGNNRLVWRVNKKPQNLEKKRREWLARSGSKLRWRLRRGDCYRKITWQNLSSDPIILSHLDKLNQGKSHKPAEPGSPAAPHPPVTRALPAQGKIEDRKSSKNSRHKLRVALLQENWRRQPQSQEDEFSRSLRQLQQN